MCGGGGSGAGTGSLTPIVGGGFAGAIISNTFTVTPAEVIAVTVGTGGTGVTGSSAGNNGSQSTFGTHATATGGLGGKEGFEDGGFYGQGESRTSCGGTFADGIKTASTNQAYGGEAGAFGNGGFSQNNTLGGNGGVGAGGGATSNNNGGGERTGAGGAGRVVVNWDDVPTGEDEFRINGTIIPNGDQPNPGTVVIIGESCHVVMQNGVEVWNGNALIPPILPQVLNIGNFTTAFMDTFGADSLNYGEITPRVNTETGLFINHITGAINVNSLEKSSSVGTAENTTFASVTVSNDEGLNITIPRANDTIFSLVEPTLYDYLSARNGQDVDILLTFNT